MEVELMVSFGLVRLASILETKSIGRLIVKMGWGRFNFLNNTPVFLHFLDFIVEKVVKSLFLWIFAFVLDH